MNIVIVGLGYVGAVTGSTLSTMGHQVTLVDKDANKVELLNRGESPIAEPGLADLIRTMRDAGVLRATTDLSEAVVAADAVIVSVGTPTDKLTGKADLTAVETVVSQVAQASKSRTRKISIAISSTVPPGTTQGVVRTILTENGLRDENFNLAFIPEFLREGTAIDDFKNPTRYVIGVCAGEDTHAFRSMRPDLTSCTFETSTEVAEMLKTVENSWHATKVTFANEIARTSVALGIDSHEVMDLLIKDTKQNVSATYMRPGFAYGGSCLPKDLRSLVSLATTYGVQVPMLASVAQSNEAHVDDAASRIASFGLARIGILGLAFKANTDDLRESPAVDLIEKLVGKGFDVKIHDFEVNRHKLFGTNLQEWNRHAHLADRLVDTPNSLIAECDLIVLTQHNTAYQPLIESLPERVKFVDVSGVFRTLAHLQS